MQKVTLELETVTPLFIAGADQRNIENEGLRAPSLRGAMRWWFRAVAGGSIDTVEKLKTEESKIFGSTDKKSIVTIIVQEKKVQRAKFKDVMNELIKSEGRDQGHRYLWFSMTYGGNENREVYLPGSTFTVTIRSYDRHKLDLALGSLWYAIHLGGIGTRSRRGGGSLKVINSEGIDDFEFVFEGKSISDAKVFIERNLQKIFDLYSNMYKGSYGIDGICILKNGYSEISIMNKEFRDFRDALSDIGAKYREHRRSLKPQQRYTLGLPFGRPLTHSKTGSQLHKLRHSSPLFFRVMDLNGKCTILITKFFTSIHPELNQNKKWVKHNLRDFDSDIGEIQISIPKVMTA